MPGNDLPLYPTPQQATYTPSPSHHAHSSRKTSKSSSNGQYRNNYGHLQPQGYQQSQPRSHYQQAPASGGMNAAPTPQQYYSQQGYQQSMQSPPHQYQSPQYQAAPAPAPAPAPPQHYYQPQPLPQAPQAPQAAPMPSQYSAPPPQHQQRYQPNVSTPVQASAAAPPVHQQVPQYGSQSHPHKRPPPSTSTSSSPHHRSKENLDPVSTPSSKSSSKQKLENELRSVFEKVDSNRSGRISARELSMALLNFDHTRFQDSTILLMVKLFSTSGSPSTSLKSLNFDQFVSLWKYLSAYKKLFIAADTNRSGDISFGEFQKIIEQIGYKLNIDLVLHLFQKFSNKDLDNYDSGVVGKLKFDAFIELLVYLRKLTDIFKKYDKDLSGVATINFSDFLFEVSNLS